MRSTLSCGVMMSSRLFHLSSWEHLSTLSAGDVFILAPGPQGAEGTGVYFSEGAPRVTAAEGVGRDGLAAVVVIQRPDTATGWYRTKGSVCRKHKRPRTWHTQGKNLALRVVSRSGVFLFCAPLGAERKKDHEIHND